MCSKRSSFRDMSVWVISTLSILLIVVPALATGISQNREPFRVAISIERLPYWEQLIDASSMSPLEVELVVIQRFPPEDSDAIELPKRTATNLLSARSDLLFDFARLARTWSAEALIPYEFDGRIVGVEIQEGFVLVPLDTGKWRDTDQITRFLSWATEPLALAPVSPVTLDMPPRPLYVGEYVKVGVTIQADAGLSFDDLSFSIPAGAKGGLVSYSRDDDFDTLNPDIMLLAGYEPGDYELQAIVNSSGAIVGLARFSISTLWDNEREGPSRWVSGDYELYGIQGATWGGGSSTTPDNFSVKAVTGTRQVAVLLVDTASQRFNQSDIQTIIDLWEDVVFDGQVINGKTVSVADYYTEVSYGNFTFDGDVFGPVHLSGVWNDYLNDSGSPKGAGIWQACATAGDSLIDYSQYQHLVCVVQTVDATAITPRKRVWGWADPNIVKVAEGDIPLGKAQMPADGNLFDLVAVLSHELGHNLGLGDIYPWNGHTPQIQARELDGWALMADHSALPHMVLVHRMMLGWIPKDDLKLYNFDTIGGFIDETVTLAPVEIGNPASGQYSGVEIRITPGWDYYFEYRLGQITQIGDQTLPTNDRVLGTDVMFSEGFENLQRRKPVMLLEEDSDGDGSVLGVNQDYEEQDTSDPIPTDFRVEVTDIDGTKAELHIQYGIYSQPDPSIQRWTPPVYRSPDIEVQNARSQADPQWSNVPWLDHHNTLVAKITNRGDMDADDVIVDFYIKEYTTNETGTQSTRVATIKQDVPAGSTVDFKATDVWMPLTEGHYCVEVRIRHYQTPGTNSVIEATEFNNVAQSNYDRFISSTASPASREVTSVRVQNPFDVSALINLRVVKSTSPLYRTYLEHTWLVLEPGETRDVRVMFEYYPNEDTVWLPELERYISLPNDVSIDATVLWSESVLEESPIPLGGITARIVTGKATYLTDLRVDPPYVSGQVLTVEDNTPVPGGKVILSLLSDPEDPATEQSIIASVDSDGYFQTEIPETWRTLKAYYAPLERYGDATSDVIQKP